MQIILFSPKSRSPLGLHHCLRATREKHKYWRLVAFLQKPKIKYLAGYTGASIGAVFSSLQPTNVLQTSAAFGLQDVMTVSSPCAYIQNMGITNYHSRSESDDLLRAIKRSS